MAEIFGEKFYTQLREAMEAGDDLDKVAEKLLNDMDVRENIKKLIIANARRYLRASVTAPSEHAALDHIKHGQIKSAASELVASSFALPTGEYVMWTEATASQHRQRAQWQMRKAQSIAGNAQLHELAATLIEEAGVLNLGQIESIDIRNHPELVTAVGGEEVLESLGTG